MKPFGFRVALLCLPLAGCATPGMGTPPVDCWAPPRLTVLCRTAPDARARFTLKDMAGYVDRISAQPPAARHADVGRLQRAGTLSPTDRLKLAYLLSLDGTKNEDVAESSHLLDGLDQAFSDTGIQLYVRLLQRTVALEIANAHANARADDLEQKLAQLKKLELDLMRRNQTPPQPGGTTK